MVAQTRRAQLVELLQLGERTPHMLAVDMEMKVKDVLEDLAHVRKSLGPRLLVKPAECAACGFVFRKRDRLGTPSRCPQCRSERIDGPWLSVRD